MTEDKEKNGGVQRVTVSLPQGVYRKLEELVEAGNWKNRSQVLAQLVRQEFVESEAKNPEAVMAGTITLFYSEEQPGVLSRIAEIERKNIEEVISTHRVLLEKNYMIEVLVVQGRVRKLQTIVNELLNIKGVEAGKLALTSTILPPIQA
jgi:CopG family transcriptional regulator, nickel-responsive regulator